MATKGFKGLRSGFVPEERTEQVVVRMTQAEKDLLTVIAAQAALDVDAWMRATCVAAARGVIPKKREGADA